MHRNDPRPVILLVEDELFTREEMTEVLRDEAAHLLVAADGRQGLELFREHAPDIVITDLLMPGMNGLDMAKCMRELDPDANIVIVTACGDLDDFGEAADLPVNYLWKPVDIEKLIRLVRQGAQNTRNSLPNGLIPGTPAGTFR